MTEHRFCCWASELRDIKTCYDTSPIDPSAQKAPIISTDTQIICSDLRRSTDSAMRLFDRFDESTALFREAELPDLPVIPLIGPSKMILALSRFSWGLGRSKGCESFKDFRARYDRAADALIDRHSLSGAPVVLMGHAFLNHYIAKALHRQRWSGPRVPDARHWAVSQYHPPT